MRVDHKTLLQEQNAVAHLDSLRKELSIIQQEIGFNQSKNESLKDSNQRILQEATTAMEWSRDQAENAHQLMANAETIVRQASERETNSINLAKSIEKITQSKISLAQEQLDKTIQETFQGKQTLADIDMRVDTNSVLLLNLQDEVARYQKAIDDLKFHFRQISDAKQQDQIDAEVQYDETIRALTEVREELAEASRLLSEETSKIESPRNFIKEEQSKLDNRERDIDVYASRTRAAYNKQFGLTFK